MGSDRASGSIAALKDHLRRFFRSHPIELVPIDGGPIRQRVPDFHIFRVAPGPRTRLWTFVTAGVWAATEHDGHGLEFILATWDDDEACLERLKISAFYHVGPPHQRLDLGHTVPIGEPWVAGSACDHFLVSLPYPYGPELEVCAWPGGQARLLWLLPITKAERDFKAANGLEALESRLDAQGVNFWDPQRRSVV
ncbi:MAG: suppressor of fused domain protein [Acidimicrobiales bacterium]